jgi:hypothetical protein
VLYLTGVENIPPCSVRNVLVEIFEPGSLKRGWPITDASQLPPNRGVPRTARFARCTQALGLGINRIAGPMS